MLELGAEGCELRYLLALNGFIFRDQPIRSYRFFRHSMLPALSGPVRSGGKCNACYCGDVASRNTALCVYWPGERAQPPPAYPLVAR
jgi:hypothetical protein